jgi:hypothetical protein
VDTWGEQFYGIREVMLVPFKSQEYYLEKDWVLKWENYLKAVIRKLNKGGQASIFPCVMGDLAPKDKNMIKEILKKMEQDEGVKIIISGDEKVLKIYKKEINQK